MVKNPWFIRVEPVEKEWFIVFHHITSGGHFHLEIAENIFFFEETYDGGLCKAAENFEDEINMTNKEGNKEKTVEKLHFVELSEDYKIYIIKQINKPISRVLHCDKTVRTFENTRET